MVILVNISQYLSLVDEILKLKSSKESKVTYKVNSGRMFSQKKKESQKSSGICILFRGFRIKIFNVKSPSLYGSLVDQIPSLFCLNFYA